MCLCASIVKLLLKVTWNLPLLIVMSFATMLQLILHCMTLSSVRVCVCRCVHRQVDA